MKNGEKIGRTGTFSVQPGQRRIRIKQEQHEEIETAAMDEAKAYKQDPSNAISRQTDIPFSTAQKILRKILKLYE